MLSRYETSKKLQWASVLFMIKTSETQNNYFAWLSHQTDVWTQYYMKNKCKQVNKIEVEEFHFVSVPSNNIK